MRVVDGVVDSGLGGAIGRKPMRVRPSLKRSLLLYVCKTIFADVNVLGDPAHGNGAKPHRKVGDHPLLHLAEVVDLHKQGGRRELFEDVGAAVEVSHSRKWGIDGELVRECWHLSLRRR